MHPYILPIGLFHENKPLTYKVHLDHVLSVCIYPRERARQTRFNNIGIEPKKSEASVILWFLDVNAYIRMQPNASLSGLSTSPSILVGHAPTETALSRIKATHLRIVITKASRYLQPCSVSKTR